MPRIVPILAQPAHQALSITSILCGAALGALLFQRPQSRS
jgi:hypothetical protein